MPGLSKVIVLDPDARAGRQVQLGFEREGVPTEVIATDVAPDLPLDLPGDDTGLVVVGGVNGAGVELVHRARAELDAKKLDAPIVFAGRGVERAEACAAGADEVVLAPAYLRDVVTIGRLLRGLPARQRAHLAGNLVEITGVYTLVRALMTLGRSATLTLIRGLRRGEVRFYHGEVTSAQVGMIHGQAALHQLLLWTDARFDFHHEDIVRRQQIPLTRDELLADAERFLESVRDSSGGLSPSVVLEPNLPRIQVLGKQIPTEVYGILRMFDGHRVLADVLEDSAYRVFETLRVSQRAVDIGLLRVVDKQPPRASWKAVLAIEEWLIGRDAGESGSIALPTALPNRRAESIAERDPRSKAKGKRRKTRRPTPHALPNQPADADIDWGALVPRVVGAEVGPLAGVVPASHVSGEIQVIRQAAAAPALPERGPSVVFDEAAGAEPATATKPSVTARLAAAEPTDPPFDKAVTARLTAAADPTEPAAEPSVTATLAAAEPTEPPFDKAVTARLAAAADPTEPAAEPSEPLLQPRGVSPESSGQLTKPYTATPAELSGQTNDLSGQTTKPYPAASDIGAAAASDAHRAVAATLSMSSQPVVADEDLEVTKREKFPHRTQIQTPGITIAETSNATVVVRDVVTVDGPSGATTVRITSTPTATVTVRDSAPSEISGATTMRFASTPPGPTPIEAALAAATAIAPPATSPPAVTAAVAPPAATASAPDAIVDEPSDGVVREHITTIKTAPVKRRRTTSDPPKDRPEPTKGEINASVPVEAVAAVTEAEPSILVADLSAPPDAEPTLQVADQAAQSVVVAEQAPPVVADKAEKAEPATAEPSIEPSILVADLAAAHAAVSAATALPTTPRSADAASPAREAEVAALRHDAAAFSETEEAFFRAGHDHAVTEQSTAESFADLDEGYRPVSFWDRVRGRKSDQPARTKSPDKSTAAGAPATRPSGGNAAPSMLAAAKPAAPAASESAAPAASAPAAPTTSKPTASAASKPAKLPTGKPGPKQNKPTGKHQPSNKPGKSRR